MASPRQALSRERILHAAVPLVEERGVNGFTMRALAERLGVSVAATYKHVANKNAVLRMLADDLSEKILAMDNEEGDPFDQIKTMMFQIYNTFKRYPGMAAHSASRMDEYQSIEVVDRVMACFAKLGFDRKEAETRVLALITYTSGHLLIDLGPKNERQGDLAFELAIDLFIDGARGVLGKRR
jgi:AcrR family transcriptional regulator